MEYEKNYWDNRYKNGQDSGAGSYGEQLQHKLRLLSELKDINSISEFGCGDFNFGKHILEIFPNAIYTGMDVSEFIVEKNRELYPKYNFTSVGLLPKADLVLCVDVLFHVIYPDEVEEILKNLEQAWTKYLVITAYERDEDKFNHVRIRKFDYERFGQPIVREIVEEDGSLYIYVFKK